MITLYTWATPNGKKISIMLEEIGKPYRIELVNISKDEQFLPKFLEVSPNNKIPAIVDDEVLDKNRKPLSIFESGAILTYLAEDSGKFLAPKGPERFKALEWLAWQVGGLGPILGQLGFFAVRSKEKAPLAIERFLTESDRLLSVMDTRLSESNYLAGDNYSIADIACYPWTFAATTFLKETLGRRIENKTAIKDWMARVADRPAVRRGMDIPKV